MVGCGKEDPPACVCKMKGKEVTQKAGTTSCVQIGTIYDEPNCSPQDQWEGYYQRHSNERYYN